MQQLSLWHQKESFPRAIVACNAIHQIFVLKVWSNRSQRTCEKKISLNDGRQRLLAREVLFPMVSCKPIPSLFITPSFTHSNSISVCSVLGYFTTSIALDVQAVYQTNSPYSETAYTIVRHKYTTSSHPDPHSQFNPLYSLATMIPRVFYMAKLGNYIYALV